MLLFTSENFADEHNAGGQEDVHPAAMVVKLDTLGPCYLVVVLIISSKKTLRPFFFCKPHIHLIFSMLC